ncbi:DUF4397 domain-containing protein [Mucilaginibacter arboris]|uniref:DUF4397 domain-containing protein n=1 Tax=Mucilaginibacter arboris TaxID=2682090 RepID=A0A7K1SUP4_9SPHI|nr:DUF4397 domain-containing protein [Mucilaginibacter arboris]MVN21045.1 DUF4397 domain-containing protein [Mucilaginibacter arboris]
MFIQSFFNRFCCFAVLAIAIAGISSCKSSTTATASVRVINVSPDAGPVNFYLSGSLKTTAPVTYGNSFGYFSAIAGSQTAEVKSSTSASTLVSSPVNITKDANYSVFVCGLATTNSVNTIVAQDILTMPSPGKAKVRFVHAVAGAPQVNLSVNSGVLFLGVGYKSVTDYTEITAGTYSIKAISTDVSAVGVTTAFNQTFENGKIYTIYFKGLVGANTDALKLNLGVIATN